MATNRIACIGECMLEMVSSHVTGALPDRQLGINVSFGGDTLNTAAYLARCGERAGLSVAYVTLLGCDALSAQLLSQWQRLGIDTSLVGRHPQRLPGLYLIETDAAGERRFHYWRAQSAARLLFDSDSSPSLPSLFGFECIYLTGITLAILGQRGRGKLLDFLAEYHSRGGLLAFDCNYRAGLWEDLSEAQSWMERIWPLCAIALPGMDDLQQLYPQRSDSQIVSSLTAYGISQLIIKRGARAPLLLMDGQEQAAPALLAATRIVDTTGAGDSFNGAYLAARLSGRDCHNSVVAGHRMALEVIARRGAIVD